MASFMDVALLKVCTARKDYQMLSPLAPQSALSPETTGLLTLFGTYYEKYPTHEQIDWQIFLPWFERMYPNMKADKLEQWKGIFRTVITKTVDDDTRRNLVSDLSENEMFMTLANMAERHAAGELPDAMHRLTEIFDTHKKRLGFKEIKYIDTPIGDLLQDEFDDTGISWRLDCLNNSMRKLRGGDFGIIAARPDQGKTSFIASEVTHMAAQLPPDRNVIWLNNEGPGKRIIPRWYQAALNLSMTQMKELHADGKLVDMYRAAVGGRLDRIRVFDIHGLTNTQVELLIEQNNPGIVVYDMIDNIRGFGDAARTDLALEHMYQWARERSVKYDCIGFATSQISNDGDNMRFPTIGMLKDSKTGKQGACDFQIMLGSTNDPGFQSSRFIGVVKNKLRLPDGPGNPQCEVIFDGIRSRYKDIPLEAKVG